MFHGKAFLKLGSRRDFSGAWEQRCNLILRILYYLQYQPGPINGNVAMFSQTLPPPTHLHHQLTSDPNASWYHSAQSTTYYTGVTSTSIVPSSHCTSVVLNYLLPITHITVTYVYYIIPSWDHSKYKPSPICKKASVEQNRENQNNVPQKRQN